MCNLHWCITLLALVLRWVTLKLHCSQPIRIYIYIDKVNLGTEISTTKQLSENVAQPGIEPGSPDYRSDALTTQPLNQPHWGHILLGTHITVQHIHSFGLEMVMSEETISHILCNQDHVTTPRSIGDARPYPPGN